MSAIITPTTTRSNAAERPAGRANCGAGTWGENQKIKVAEALRICTLHGAYASFEEKIKGTITPGKLADFVVLRKDPHTTDPVKIKEIPVVRTVVGGKTVHTKDGE